MSVAPPTEQIVTCPGCGGRNPTGSNECDWCGRPFVSKGGRLRLTIWQLLTSLLLLGLIGAVAALAYLNQGRALPPVRASSATDDASLDVRAHARGHPARESPPTRPRHPAPVTSPQPGPRRSRRRPSHRHPNRRRRPNSRPRASSIPAAWAFRCACSRARSPARQGVLREGTRVLLTGNDQTVAARPWREIETEDHNLKGWVQGDFLQLQPTAP